MGTVKKNKLVNLILFLLLITLISSLALAWSPQDDIDLKYRYNIVNDTAGNCLDGYVMQGRLQNGSWNCTLGTSFDTNETTWVNKAVTSSCSGTDKVTGISVNGTLICEGDEGGNITEGKRADGDYLYNSSTVMYFNETRLNGTIDIKVDNLNSSYNTTTLAKDDDNYLTVVLSWLTGLFYEKSEVYNTTEIESMNDSIRADVSDTNETDRVDELVLANVSTNLRIGDLNDSYNTTTLLKDDDNFLSVDQTWLDGIYLSIVNFEVFNTSLYGIFYEQSEIELMNTTLTTEDSRINTELINLENNFTNENTSVWSNISNVENDLATTNTNLINLENNFTAENTSLWSNISNAEVDIVSNSAYLDNLQSNFTNQNSTYYDEFVNITGDGEILSNNLTMADTYYWKGQPITGGINNGILWADEIDGNGNVNLTHTSGLNLQYPDMIVRIVSTDGTTEKYCNITSGSVAVTDNSHLAYFVVASSCAISSAPVATFIGAAVNLVGNTPIFHVMAHSGTIEVYQGLPIMNRLAIKDRLLSFKTINLDVVSGLSLTKGANLNFTINLGEYIFVEDAVDATKQNSSVEGIEIFYRDASTYTYDENENGLNLTSCEDAAQNMVTCSNPTKYRRYFIFLTGYSDGADNTEIHQRLASDATYYTTLAGCLNTETNPISYDLPDIYDYTAVPLYAYCVQATSTTFDGSFIDLRTVQTGQASGGIDTSVFLTKDGTRPLIGDWNTGPFNITSIITADVNNSYFSWNGSFLEWAFGDIYTVTTIEGINNTLNGRIDSLNSTFLAENVSIWNNISNIVDAPDTTCDGETCSVTNTGTLDGYEGATLNINTNCSTSGGCATVYQDTNLVLDAGTSWTGDLGGTGSAPSVDDDSHNHIGTNIDAGTFNSGEYIFPDNISAENYTVGGNGGGLIHWNGSHTIIS